MFTYLVVVCSIFICVSCTDREENSFDVDKFMPTSKRDYNFNDDTSNVYQLNKELSVKGFDTLVYFLVGSNEWREIRKKNYLHRFGSNQELTLEMVRDMDTSFWFITTYSDSLMTRNALFNWLDCYGDNCESIRIGEEKKMKSLSSQIWQLDTMIIYFESKGKNISNADRDSLTSYLSESLRMHFYWSKNQKINWDLRENHNEE